MKKLRALGYWRQPMPTPEGTLWVADPQVILLALGATQGHPHVIAYLRNGHRFETWRGWSYCRLKCGISQPEMGHSDLRLPLVLVT